MLNAHTKIFFQSSFSLSCVVFSSLRFEIFLAKYVRWLMTANCGILKLKTTARVQRAKCIYGCHKVSKIIFTIELYKPYRVEVEIAKERERSSQKKGITALISCIEITEATSHQRKTSLRHKVDRQA